MNQKILKQVANTLDLPINVIDLAYRSYWEFIRAKIKELPLKEDLTEEQFSNLRTNFNIPSLGKLVCTYDRVLGVKKRLEYIKSLKKDDKN